MTGERIPQSDKLTLFQRKAVAIIRNIRGMAAAEELAEKYVAAYDAIDGDPANWYELDEIVPIPAKCPRCKREFLGRDAIRSPSLDNVCCFYCGPNRSQRLIPHPDYPVVDAKTKRHGLFSTGASK
jgi:hypothetical protein